MLSCVMPIDPVMKGPETEPMQFLKSTFPALCIAAVSMNASAEAEPKPSFNCAKAGAPIEVAICSDARLAASAPHRLWYALQGKAVAQHRWHRQPACLICIGRKSSMRIVVIPIAGCSIGFRARARFRLARTGWSNAIEVQHGVRLRPCSLPSQE